MDDKKIQLDVIKKHYTHEQLPDGSLLVNGDLVCTFNDSGYLHSDIKPALHLGIKIGWWLDGTEFSFEEWCIKLNKTEEEMLLLRLQYG